MAKSNARTVYATAETWDGWKDAAWRSRMSVSELIRRAVEAYDAVEGDPAKAGASNDSVERGQGGERVGRTAGRSDHQPAVAVAGETGGAGPKRSRKVPGGAYVGPSVGAPAPPFRGPVTKADQTRRKKP